MPTSPHSSIPAFNAPMSHELSPALTVWTELLYSRDGVDVYDPVDFLHPRVLASYHSFLRPNQTVPETPGTILKECFKSDFAVFVALLFLNNYEHSVPSSLPPVFMRRDSSELHTTLRMLYNDVFIGLDESALTTLQKRKYILRTDFSCANVHSESHGFGMRLAAKANQHMWWTGVDLYMDGAHRFRDSNTRILGHDTNIVPSIGVPNSEKVTQRYEAGSGRRWRSIVTMFDNHIGGIDLGPSLFTPRREYRTDYYTNTQKKASKFRLLSLPANEAPASNPHPPYLDILGSTSLSPCTFSPGTPEVRWVGGGYKYRFIVNSTPSPQTPPESVSETENTPDLARFEQCKTVWCSGWPEMYTGHRTNVLSELHNAAGGPVFRQLPDEKDYLRVGMEVEVSQRLSVRELQMIVTSVAPFQDPFFICKHDGSIQPDQPSDGKLCYEIVTLPCSIKYLRQQWRILFEKIERLCKNKGVDPSHILMLRPNRTCGIHVHIDAENLKGKHLPRLAHFVNSSEHEDLMYVLSMRRSIRNNGYITRPEGAWIDNTSARIRSLYGRTELPRDHYNMLNVCSGRTAELRIFQSMFSLSHITYCLAVVEALVAFTKEKYGIGFYTETTFIQWLQRHPIVRFRLLGKTLNEYITKTREANDKAADGLANYIYNLYERERFLLKRAGMVAELRQDIEGSVDPDVVLKKLQKMYSDRPTVRVTRSGSTIKITESN